MKWVKDNWTEKRPPRVGLFFYDHTSGFATLDAIQRHAPEGVEFVGYEVIPLLGAIDTTVEWLRLARKKPDWVFLTVCASSLVTAVEDAARLKLQEEGIKLCVFQGALNVEILRIVGEDGERWYNIVSNPFTSDVELPGMSTVIDTVKKSRGWGPEETPTLYIKGWLMAMVTSEAVRIAIDWVGLENLAGRAVRDALASYEGVRHWPDAADNYDQ